MKNLKTLLVISALPGAGIAQAASHAGAPMAQDAMAKDAMGKDAITKKDEMKK